MSFGAEGQPPDFSANRPSPGGGAGGDRVDVRELAALWALGAATAEEVEAFEALVKSGDAEAVAAAASCSVHRL